MADFRLVLLVLLVLLLAAQQHLQARAVAHVRYDNQYTWTRMDWQHVKLPLFVDDGLARGLGKHTEVDEYLLSSSMLGTVTGPQWREALQLMHKPVRQKRVPLDMILAGAAGELLQCEMCTFLAREFWERAIEKLLVVLHTKPFTLSDAETHVTMSPRSEGSCTMLAMHKFLVKQAVWQLNISSGGLDASGAAATNAAPPEFALCTRVTGDKQLDEELVAATRACEVCQPVLTILPGFPPRHRTLGNLMQFAGCCYCPHFKRISTI